MGAYFGTDGVRGVANTEISPELAFRLGRYGGYVLTRKKQGQRAKVVIGQDTRISGDMLEAALVAGLLSIGADVIRLGVLPTPGVAYATKAFEADAGVMISASHNPLEDNGIKFFGADGYKLSDELESEIEALLEGESNGEASIAQVPRPVGSGVGTAQYLPEIGYLRYFTHLKSTVQHRFDGLKIVIDCANGAASAMAFELFNHLGAETIVLANDPDGLNINDQCGSTHPEFVRKQVLAHGAHLGLSFDGDADRLIAVDEKGNIVDGDQILYVLSKDMAKKHQLKRNTVVTTVMSNLGLSKSLQREGIEVKKSKVGDRYVMERMLQGGYNLGGEPSGHLILLDFATTGDGLLSALQLTQVIAAESTPLSELTAGMTKYPQLLVNVRAEEKHKLDENERIQAAIRSVEHHMGGSGRVLVRPSGTEPLVRVMVEGPNEQELPLYVETITEAIKDELTRVV